jgi:hypothetical protein
MTDIRESVATNAAAWVLYRGYDDENDDPTRGALIIPDKEVEIARQVARRVIRHLDRLGALNNQPSPCPFCFAHWTQTEILGEARHGGGYRLTCNECHHEWDDLHASHASREEQRREEEGSA